jgi:hypothetical protein
LLGDDKPGFKPGLAGGVAFATVDQRQAQSEATRLNSEHPDRDKFRWVALARGAETWAVVKSARRSRVDPLKATTEAVPKPPQPEDPNFGPISNLPGYR